MARPAAHTLNQRRRAEVAYSGCPRREGHRRGRRSLWLPRIVSGALMVLLASCGEAGVGGEAPGSSLSGGEGAPVPAVSVFQPPSSNAAAAAAEAPTTPAPTTPSPDPAFVLGGLDTDQPCTAKLTGGHLTRIGVGPEDVPAMSPGRELLRAVSKLPEVEGYEWGVSSGFRDNADLADESGSPNRCEAFMRVGRVTGYAAEASRECLQGDCPGDPNVPELVVATVHVMQTDAGAQAFLDWMASTPWGVAGAQPAVYLNDSALDARPGRVEHIHRGGHDLTRVVDRSDVGEVELILVRQGAVVGEVLVMGPPGAKPAVDALALGVAAAKRIASVSPGPDGRLKWSMQHLMVRGVVRGGSWCGPAEGWPVG